MREKVPSNKKKAYMLHLPVVNRSVLKSHFLLLDAAELIQELTCFPLVALACSTKGNYHPSFLYTLTCLCLICTLCKYIV